MSIALAVRLYVVAHAVVACLAGVLEAPRRASVRLRRGRSLPAFALVLVLVTACSARAKDAPSEEEEGLPACDAYVQALTDCVSRGGTAAAEAAKAQRPRLEAQLRTTAHDEASRTALRERCIAAREALAKTCGTTSAEAAR